MGCICNKAKDIENNENLNIGKGEADHGSLLPQDHPDNPPLSQQGNIVTTGGAKNEPAEVPNTTQEVKKEDLEKSVDKSQTNNKKSKKSNVFY
jgi:hypothetical protein